MNQFETFNVVVDHFGEGEDILVLVGVVAAEVLDVLFVLEFFEESVEDWFDLKLELLEALMIFGLFGFQILF